MEVDGRWWNTSGHASLSSDTLGFAAPATESNYLRRLAIRRGFRRDVFVLDYLHARKTLTKSGAVLHFQDIENYMFVQVACGGTDTVALYKVVAGHPTQLAIGSAFTLGGSDTVKCVITESGGAQTLTVYVAGTSRLSTGTIDDIWSAGHGVGVIHDVLPVKELCDRLKTEYAAAQADLGRFQAAE